MSSTRSCANGPRSLMRTTVDRRFLRFVTRTRAPMGNDREAAVNACWSNRSPLAVRFPWNLPPYQDAVPTCTGPGLGANEPGRCNEQPATTNAGTRSATVARTGDPREGCAGMLNFRMPRVRAAGNPLSPTTSSSNVTTRGACGPARPTRRRLSCRVGIQLANPSGGDRRQLPHVGVDTPSKQIRLQHAPGSLRSQGSPSATHALVVVLLDDIVVVGYSATPWTSIA
jgi:hypothetical protein